MEVEIREQQIEKRDNAREEKKEGLMEKQIEQVSKMAYAAVQKELKYEEMLEHEEMLRQQDEEREMQEQVAREEEKERMLKRSLAKKVRSTDKVRRQLTIAKKMDEMKNEAYQSVMHKRQEENKRLAALRKIAARKKKQAKNKILRIRMEMTNELILAEHNGDILQCSANATNEDMQTYCENNFTDDAERFIECNRPEDFCYICCETEFGELHEEHRDECYDKCDFPKDFGDVLEAIDGEQTSMVDGVQMKCVPVEQGTEEILEELKNMETSDDFVKKLRRRH